MGEQLLPGRHDTAEQALAAWDRGESVWSIEMGGLGPGYEQAIQALAFEIIRDFRMIPFGDDWGDATAHRHSGSLGGLSGAQVGAAKNIAAVFIKYGHIKGIDMAQQDRRIQVSKFWPRAIEEKEKRDA